MLTTYSTKPFFKNPLSIAIYFKNLQRSCKVSYLQTAWTKISAFSSFLNAPSVFSPNRTKPSSLDKPNTFALSFDFLKFFIIGSYSHTPMLRSFVKFTRPFLNNLILFIVNSALLTVFAKLGKLFQPIWTIFACRVRVRIRVRLFI